MEHARSFQMVPLETAAAGGLNPCLQCDAPSLPGSTEGDTRWLRTVDEWARENRFDTFWEQAFARRVLAATPGIEADDVEIQHYVKVGLETFKVDFFVPKARLILEIDGYAKDGAPVTQVEIEKRNRRDATFQSDGLTILHFSNAQVSFEPESCRRQVASILSARTTQQRDSPEVFGSTQSREDQNFTGSAEVSLIPNLAAAPIITAPRRTMLWISIVLIAIVVLFGFAITFLSQSEPTPSTPDLPIQTTQPSIPIQSTQSILPTNGDCPSTHPLKGNNASDGELIVHAPDQQFYGKTFAELCFANLADAEAEGYRPAKQ